MRNNAGNLVQAQVITGGVSFAGPPPPEPPAELRRPPEVCGREPELAELRATFARQGTVVLTGPPGTGKCTLASALAEEVRADYPDGQLRADLGGPAPRPAAEVLGDFLRSLHDREWLVPAGDEARERAFRTVLGGRRILILLLNASQADLDLFRPGAGSRSGLIATTRDRTAGIELGPMTAEDSIALLRKHIGVRVDEEPAAALAFARACGLLPLALEVAARAARNRPHATLAALVAKIPRGRGEVYDAFDWSYRQLPAEAATVFRLCGLAFGPLDQSALAALTGLPERRLDEIQQSLLAKNLVTSEPGDRLGMHHLLRSYARSLAEELDRPAWREAAVDRLLAHHLTALRADPGYADAEGPTLFAAVRLARDTDRHAQVRDLARALAEYHDLRRHGEQWPEIQAAAVAAARWLADEPGLARALADLGHACFEAGELDAAAAHHEESVRLCWRLGDQATLRRALNGLGNLALRQGRDATEVFAEVHRISVAEGDRRGEARAHLSLGRATRDPAHFQRARELCTEIDDQEGLARALNGLGNLAAVAGNAAEAIDWYRQSLAVRPDPGVLVNLGRAAPPETALACYEQAAELARRQNNTELLADLGQLLHDLGHTDRAVALLAEAEGRYLRATAPEAP